MAVVLVTSRRNPCPVQPTLLARPALLLSAQAALGPILYQAAGGPEGQQYTWGPSWGRAVKPRVTSWVLRPHLGAPSLCPLACWLLWSWRGFSFIPRCPSRPCVPHSGCPACICWVTSGMDVKPWTREAAG